MTIERIVPNLSSEFSSLLRKRFANAVVRKRSPMWFFKNTIRDSPVIREKPEICPDKPLPIGPKARNKLTFREIISIWQRMDPESKRKFFNMAELDELRYQEQKARWLAAVGSILSKSSVIDKAVIDKAIEKAPDFKSLQNDFLKSLEEMHDNYDQLIQIESIKMLYKEELKSAAQNTNCRTADQLADSLPEIFRPVLSKPRRPPSPFLLYMFDNLQKFEKTKRKIKERPTLHNIAASRWANLDKKTRQQYEQNYELLLQQYQRNKKLFNSQMDNTINLEQASKEKRAFRKSLRKRLRESSVLPVNTRNSFCFFIRDHGVSLTTFKELSKIWRDLPEHSKDKYLEMVEEDRNRYQLEKVLYDRLKKLTLEQPLIKESADTG